jgi:hypothetical protein
MRQQFADAAIGQRRQGGREQNSRLAKTSCRVNCERPEWVADLFIRRSIAGMNVS